MTTAPDWLDSQEFKVLLFNAILNAYGDDPDMIVPAIDNDILVALKAAIRKHFVPREEYERVKTQLDDAQFILDEIREMGRDE